MPAVPTEQKSGFDPAAGPAPTGSRGRAIGGHADAALRLAGDVQRSLITVAPLPSNSLAVHTVYQPAGHVSGDVYSFRDTHDAQISLALADVTGHGLAAAMMATFVLRALADSNGTVESSPSQRLQVLNEELVATACPHAPFAAALAATYDLKLHRVQWARGGVPYPIHVRPGQRAVQLRSAGCILGAFEQVTLQSRFQALQPGESVIFHTDGLDALLLHEGGERIYECISQTPWFESLGDRPVRESLADIERIRREVGDRDWPVDDLTMVAVTRRF